MPRGRPGEPSLLRGRTYEDIHGVERARELRAQKFFPPHARDSVDQAVKGRKISATLTGRKLSDTHRAAISKAMTGKKYGSRPTQKAGLLRHQALDLPSCRCYAHGAARPYMISSYTWKLADALIAAGFEVVIPEQQFGYKRVDVLLGEEWLAFEADGAYHFTPGRRDYDKKRDAELQKWFDLPVVRLSGAEVNKLWKRLCQDA